MECEPIGNIIYNYKCEDIIDLIKTILNKDLNKPLNLENQEHNNTLSYIKKYFKDELKYKYGIDGYNIVIDEDYYKIPNTNYDYLLSVFGKAEEYINEYKDYLMIVKE